MAAAWHSTVPGTEVYHNNKKCDLGDNINPKYKKPGIGGKKRLCERCAELNRPKPRK